MVWSGRVNLYVIFFRSLIDFDLIEGHLIPDRVGSGQIRIESNQFDFLKKNGSDRIRVQTDFSGQVGFCHV
jgi:hypothetical protein